MNPQHPTRIEPDGMPVGATGVPASGPTSPVLAVTGGASGIGLATACQWLSDGGRAILLDVDRNRLADAVQALEDTNGVGRVRGVVMDVTDPASVEAAFHTVLEHEGRLDALVNCAGNARPVDSAEMSDADWDAVLNVHLTGSMRACRAAYTLLADSGGAIVNLSSVASRAGMPRRASYTTVKAGLEGLTRTLAVEWAAAGIRVNAVGPGYVQTPLTDALIAAGTLRADLVQARVPMRRFAQPAEIADAIIYLCGPRASYITGHTLMVDGGMTVDGDWYGEQNQ